MYMYTFHVHLDFADPSPSHVHVHFRVRKEHSFFIQATCDGTSGRRGGAKNGLAVFFVFCPFSIVTIYDYGGGVAKNQISSLGIGVKKNKSASLGEGVHRMSPEQKNECSNMDFLEK